MSVELGGPQEALVRLFVFSGVRRSCQVWVDLQQTVDNLAVVEHETSWLFRRQATQYFVEVSGRTSVGYV